jgi:uncharacterized protein YbbC (DUF1343 family)
MEACVQAGVSILVLDRPNPLGGNILEGPVAENTGSLVSSTAIPIRHGMTMGELATWFQQRDLANLRVKLRVNYLDNWRPDLFFSDCSLPWVAPSPNIPTPETALLYVGMCLLEGTNLNEGRGTDTPFAVLGASWLDARALLADFDAKDHPGLKLSETEYTPRSIPGKSANPRFQDVVCRGIQIEVMDPERVRAFRTVVALIRAIRDRHASEFEFVPFFDTLAGGPDLRRRIESGESAAIIVEAYAVQHENFERIRPRLYDEDGIPI